MYFLTPSKPGIFLIGIYENRLYGFGENKNNKKLTIYSKSIFDCGYWDEFYTIDIEVVKAECCKTGLHVAAGIHEEKIWIAARKKEFTRIFSIDILTKKFIKYKMIKTLFEELTPLNLNLCSKCLMPTVWCVAGISDDYMFYITPRQFQKNKEIFQCIFVLNGSSYCLLLKRRVIRFRHDPSSNAAFNFGDIALSVNERSAEDNGRIKTLMMLSPTHRRIFNVPDDDIDDTWHDITFFNDNNTLTFALTQRRNVDNVTLRLYLVDMSIDMNATFYFMSSYTVDLNFPPFQSTPFVFSYTVTKNTAAENDDTKPPISLSPRFIVLQTSDGIIAVPLRMLSLSESAYLSLRQIPKPLFPSADAKVKGSIFQRMRNILRRKPKEVTDRWMSLNFIKKTMGLSNNFDLV